MGCFARCKGKSRIKERLSRSSGRVPYPWECEATRTSWPRTHLDLQSGPGQFNYVPLVIPIFCGPSKQLRSTEIKTFSEAVFSSFELLSMTIGPTPKWQDGAVITNHSKAQICSVKRSFWLCSVIKKKKASKLRTDVNEEARGHTSKGARKRSGVVHLKSCYSE